MIFEIVSVIHGKNVMQRKNSTGGKLAKFREADHGDSWSIL
jgi:hypothetical protein